MKSLFFLSILFFLVACKNGHELDCIKGTGNEIQVTRSLNSFTSIEFDCDIDLIIKNGSAHTVEIVGGINLIEGIKTNVNDNKLTISNTNTCNWVRNYKKRITVYVTCPSLNEIWNKGPGIIKSESVLPFELNLRITENGSANIQLNAPTVSVSLEGYSKVELSGKVNRLYASVQNFSTFEANQLVANRIDITIHSSAERNTKINCIDTLIGKNESATTIFCKGKPFTNFYKNNGKIVYQ